MVVASMAVASMAVARTEGTADRAIMGGTGGRRKDQPLLRI
jgi:hypothetical protein